MLLCLNKYSNNYDDKFVLSLSIYEVVKMKMWHM